MNELENLFHTNIAAWGLHEEAYSKTIYIDQSQFDDLIKFDLNFQPYISIAESCGMSSIMVMKSKTTHRFYIGFVNLAGHGPRYEVRPVRLKEMLNFEYIRKMLANHAQELDGGIDIKEKYEV
jgi:hypothetical protein